MFLLITNQNSVDPDAQEAFYLEPDIERVIRHLNDDSVTNRNYYQITTNPGIALLHRITLKGGNRPDAGGLETETAIANGQEIGSTIVAVPTEE